MMLPSDVSFTCSRTAYFILATHRFLTHALFPLCYMHTELGKKQVCLGICALDFESVLHFSDTDYDVITEQGQGVQVRVSTKFTIKTTVRSLIV
jgi:hypothetical protein